MMRVIHYGVWTGDRRRQPPRAQRSAVNRRHVALVLLASRPSAFTLGNAHVEEGQHRPE
jgi:hypothetical protein